MEEWEKIRDDYWVDYSLFINKDLQGKYNKDNGHRCFSSAVYNFNNHKEITKIIVHLHDDDTPYTEEQISKYISLLNQIAIFKIKLFKENNIYNFELLFSDYKSSVLLLAALTCIRNTWENLDYGGSRDEFYKIIIYFIKLCEKYPDEDRMYLLLWANLCLGDDFNSGHCLIINTKSMPKKLNDLHIDNYSIHKVFHQYDTLDYNKTIEKYKQELKDFKLFK